MKLKPWMAVLFSLSVPASFTSPVFATTDPSLRIAELSSDIRHHRQLYYQGLTTMSDQQFDALVVELRNLLPSHPVLEEVGSPVSVNRQPLSAPMLSLASVWDKQAVEAFVGTISQRWSDARLLMLPKFDGMALELVYKNGQLVRALTRGDGQYGQDVTANVIASGAVPLQLDTAEAPLQVVIRGELYADSKLFQSQFKQSYSSARQLAVSTALSEQPAARQLRALRFVPWQWLDAEQDSVLAGLNQLAAWGFAPVGQLIQISAHEKSRVEYYRDWKDKLAFGAELDGVVLSLDSQRLRDEWGETASEPRWSLAWKFDTPQVVTQVTAIHWQQGRTGRLTPVVEISPVNLMGRTVSRVSGRSPAWLQERHISVGSQLAVTLKGAAVPQIVQVVSATGELPEPPLVVPGLCMTRKPGCEQRLLLQLEHVRKTLRLPSPQPKQIRALVEQQTIASVADLVALYPPTQVPSLERQLAALGLPQLSREARVLLAAQLSSLRELNHLTHTQWQQLTQRQNRAAWLALQQPDMRTQIERLASLFAIRA